MTELLRYVLVGFFIGVIVTTLADLFLRRRLRHPPEAILANLIDDVSRIIAEPPRGLTVADIVDSCVGSEETVYMTDRELMPQQIITTASGAARLDTRVAIVHDHDDEDAWRIADEVCRRVGRPILLLVAVEVLPPDSTRCQAIFVCVM